MNFEHSGKNNSMTKFNRTLDIIVPAEIVRKAKTKCSLSHMPKKREK